MKNFSLKPEPVQDLHSTSGTGEYFARAILLLVTAFIVTEAVRATSQDMSGMMSLRTVTKNLGGSGIRVAQPEADCDLGTNW